jgi:hypothetical protein
MGRSSRVVTSPLSGKLRLRRRASPKPTSICPETETITYLAVMTKFDQI